MYQNNDCLLINNLHSMGSDGTSDHNNCMDWCNYNSSCGGFSVMDKTCFFKNSSCGNNITYAANVNVYIKQGIQFMNLN